VGILESPLGIIRKEAEQIKVSCKSAMKMIRSQIRVLIKEKLEGMHA
jgi:hypothetical protein